MKIMGVDLHTRQQTIAMLDDQTGELVEKQLPHEGEQVREFYAGLPKPVLVGLEATGSMRFYRRKLVQKGMGKARVAAARKLGIRLWIMLRDEIDYTEFCRRGHQRRQESGATCAGMLHGDSGLN